MPIYEFKCKKCSNIFEVLFRSSNVEVQTGEYFGEDDIERLEDKYGRI